MTEIVFLVEEEPEGGYVAQADGEGIVTEAEDLNQLKEMVRDAVNCHFPESTIRPRAFRIVLTQYGDRLKRLID